MIYLIKRIDFDNLENHEPEYEKILGYYKTETEAFNYVSKLAIDTPKYKSYYGTEYPIFSIIEVQELTTEEQPSGELPDDDLPF